MSRSARDRAVLYEEVNDQAARQRRRSERLLTVSWDDVYTCARCGRPIRSEDARYCEPPGERTSPPYREPCADALRGGRVCAGHPMENLMLQFVTSCL
jgi:hypothetical protein